MARISSALIINLIGSKKNVCFATNEIREYIFDMYLGYKVIQPYNINQLLDRTFIPHDIYINQCDLITCDELIKMHDLIQNNNNKSIHFRPYTLLTKTNKKEYDKYIHSFIGSPYIHNIYKLDCNIKQKHALLFDIIIANNLKYKS